ncbi:hypothetical protein CDAR_482001 [Caerostris darwini]|uniref:Uncharacterized protein n=1 Tax=Caerostris darwini TaxID=1538125 RepID=A0AAV4TKI4_9ARAC|nr:hypothetical protein CDAR_482001 [Caerostris darwini]
MPTQAKKEYFWHRCCCCIGDERKQPAYSREMETRHVRRHIAPSVILQKDMQTVIPFFCFSLIVGIKHSLRDINSCNPSNLWMSAPAAVKI